MRWLYLLSTKHNNYSVWCVDYIRRIIVVYCCVRHSKTRVKYTIIYCNWNKYRNIYEAIWYYVYFLIIYSTTITYVNRSILIKPQHATRAYLPSFDEPFFISSPRGKWLRIRIHKNKLAHDNINWNWRELIDPDLNSKFVLHTRFWHISCSYHYYIYYIFRVLHQSVYSKIPWVRHHFLPNLKYQLLLFDARFI